MNAKNVAQFPRSATTETSAPPASRRSGPQPLAAATDSDGLAVQFLRSFHVLLRAVRLYHQHHPRLIESLKSAGHALEDVFGGTSVLSLAIEQDRLMISNQPSGSGH